MTLTTLSIFRPARVAVVAGTLLAGAITAHAQLSPDERAERRCVHALYNAAANYAACQQMATGQEFGAKPEKARARARACVLNYDAKASEIRKNAKGTNSSCAAPRFVDNGTTVTDNVTGLQWEKKTDDDTVHDKDNRYTWNALTEDPFAAADGTLFAAFLAGLNGVGCFAGQCDWRLPTLVELQTIVGTECAPGSDPCIDPIFGSTATTPNPPDNFYFYWSATAVHGAPGSIWVVLFDAPYGPASVVTYGDGPVRAVRGGL